MRGASNEANRLNIRLVVQESKVSFPGIQESKCKEWKEKSIFSLGMGSNVGWVEVASQGLSGGLFSLWNKAIFEVSSTEHSKNWIMMKGVCKLSNILFVCVNIYAPQSPTKKLELRNLLLQKLQHTEQIPTIMLGDFNCVLHSSERKFCVYRKLDSLAFPSFLSMGNPFEIPMINS